MTHRVTGRKQANGRLAVEMGFNRNHFFLIGIFLLLVGLQFRLIERIVLNPESTLFLAQHMGSETDATTAEVLHKAGFDAALPRKEFISPRWCGWAFFAVAAALMLHSLMLPRPS